MEHLKGNAEVAKSHPEMEIRFRCGERQSASRFLGMEVKVERSEGWEERQKKKNELG